MFYQDWGFERSPFQQTSLPADEVGSRLLVGRDQQVDTLIRRIEDAPKIAVLEGLNGIGKTSVVNVAAFRLYKRFTESKGPLYIPCRKAFQLDSDVDLQQFIDAVLVEVAQTLIAKLEIIELTHDGSSIRALDKWLNSPELKSFQGGLWLVQGGMTVNSNPGFERAGFRESILRVLAELFPDSGMGGVVCCIDNLELLQESSKARMLLEQLRDQLLQAQGLCWVLCGALGITYGVVSSPRLDGYLHRPIELKEMDKSFAPAILDSRIEAFASRPGPYLPINQSEFSDLYSIVRGNLRTVLSYSGNYCQVVADGVLPVTVKEKRERFFAWLNAEAQSAYDAARTVLTPRTLEVFNKATSESGTFSPGDYETFAFSSTQAFRPYIKSLEDVQLVVSTQDDTDKRRKTIQITPKGWLVDYYLASIAESQVQPSESADSDRP
ncbi:MAG: AAA family ATPase [Puia sp.]|nr:AAA family ATPase [Puia sp.]